MFRERERGRGGQRGFCALFQKMAWCNVYHKHGNFNLRALLFKKRSLNTQYLLVFLLFCFPFSFEVKCWQYAEIGRGIQEVHCGGKNHLWCSSVLDEGKWHLIFVLVFAFFIYISGLASLHQFLWILWISSQLNLTDIP